MINFTIQFVNNPTGGQKAEGIIKIAIFTATNIPDLKNPKWHRDEIILALDLYFRSERGSIDKRNPNIISLSQELNLLPLFNHKPDAERFRNANGVSMKLSNFLAIDPGYQGEGLSSYSNLDESIFHEFANDRERLRSIATRIRSVLHNETLRQTIRYIEDDEVTLLDTVQEGQTLYRLHKYRERNSAIVTAKKKAVLKATGALACEACSFDFFRTYGNIGYGFIECHHTQPLANYPIAAPTRLGDLAVVCANCHRMLHRGGSLLTVGKLKEKIRG